MQVQRAEVERSAKAMRALKAEHEELSASVSAALRGGLGGRGGAVRTSRVSLADEPPGGGTPPDFVWSRTSTLGSEAPASPRQMSRQGSLGVGQAMNADL